MPDDSSLSALAARHERPQLTGLAGMPVTDAVAIERLAALAPTEYDRCREAEAKALNVRVGTLDKMVAGARDEAEAETDGQGREIKFEVVEPWPELVDGAVLLDELAAMAGRHLILPDHGRVILPLWATLTWLTDHVRVLPILAITSPEKRCGKTTVIEWLTRLCRRARTTSNISPAALFRYVEKFTPSLLIDEADSFLKDNQALRGVLNSGHTRTSAHVIRTVGDDHEPREFSTWCPKTIAAIGRLPDTISDRSIMLAMRRKGPGETVEPMPADDTSYEARQRLARWAADHAGEIASARPDLPAGVINRRADNWRVLIAIADAAGGDWPDLARAACRAAAAADEDDSLRVSLLADIRDMFTAHNTEKLPTADIITNLVALTERPWGECNCGKAISNRQLSRWLGEFGIRSRDIRPEGQKNRKGYRLDDCTDAFARYLPFDPRHRDNPATARGSAPFDPRHVDEVVADENTRKPNGGAGCHGVTDKNPPPAAAGMDAEARIHDAAATAGIPADLLRANVIEEDLADPELDLVAYARKLAR